MGSHRCQGEGDDYHNRGLEEWGPAGFLGEAIEIFTLAMLLTSERTEVFKTDRRVSYDLRDGIETDLGIKRDSFEDIPS